ncbi:hypothetical protein RCZ04_00930 [Capnocytophaga sp. HP1101]
MHTLQWVNPPQDDKIGCLNSIPPAPELKATGADDIQVELQEAKLGENELKYVIRRHWTAYAPNAIPITHTQILKVGDTEKPEFSSYPKDYTVKSKDDIPPQESLTATDNCNGDLTYKIIKSSNVITLNGKEVVERVWYVSDYSRNENRYVQHITIDPNSTTAPGTLSFVPSALPQNLTVACEGEIPAPTNPTTQGACTNVRVSHNDVKKTGTCAHQYVIERTYAAISDCNPMQPITYKQIITINDNIAPTFVGALPQNITLKEGEAIPPQTTLTANDNCGGEVTIVPSKTETKEKVTYIWVATDVCGNQVTHQQVITISSKGQNPQPQPQIEPQEVLVIYNGVSTDNPQNYFKIENTDPKMPISVFIFDEIGLKVYENSHYGEHGDYFRGYPNVKTIGNKRLAGTYFYIVKYYYNGKQEERKGFLYVR